MNNIKKFRLAFGYTQKALAELLGTTQQSLGRWEKGDSEPKQAILKDMALLFGTTIDDLLGNNPLTDTITTNHYHLFLDKYDVSGFWGHLGVMLKEKSKHHWFPITQKTADELHCILSNPIRNNTQQPFISVHTLNNRVLWLNLNKIKGISILDYNADAPDQDWELSWDGYQGYSIEVYKALENYCYANLENCSETYSANFQREINDIVQEHHLDNTDLLDEIFHTHIYSTRGTKESFYVDAEYLWNIEWHVTCNCQFDNHFLDLSFSEMSRFKNMNQISMISAPLHPIIEVASNELAILENSDHH